MSQALQNPTLFIWLLGGFRVQVGERVLAPGEIRLRAAQQIIKLLALAPGYRLHREQVLAAIWPDQEPRAAINSLNQALHSARRAIAPGDDARGQFLILRDQQLRLGEPEQLWVDALAFEDAARRAQQQDVAAALAALDRYTGDLLPDDPYELWLDMRRTALRHAYRALVLGTASRAEQPADVERVRSAIHQALAGDPADEELHRAAMRLAARVGDRQAALGQYALLERALRHELQLEPDASSQQLYHDILAGRVAPLAAAGQAPDVLLAPLPMPLTSFIGRTRELAEVRQLLHSTRLLTIAGAGGGGKTRLALELARTEAPAYSAGACLLALAALNDPALIDQELARAVGLREGQGAPLRDQIIAFLAPRDLLLVLDNCEHLIGETARLAETLLQHCPQLRILATSREPLRIAGERTWIIPALSLPDPHRPPPGRSDIQQYEAIQLFLDRATAAWAQFSLRDAEIPDLVDICARLDGMPLAIELAAARIPTLAIAQIAARLDDRFQLLRGGSRTALTRQQTLRAAIDWSYDLLAAPERVLFRRLAVFAGGWTLEAAEAICAGDGLEAADVLPLLAQLVDKSLVVARDANEGRRFQLLETIRQYAQEQLDAAGETGALRTRHQAWYMQLATQGETELTRSRQVAWLAVSTLRRPGTIEEPGQVDGAPSGEESGEELWVHTVARSFDARRSVSRIAGRGDKPT
jgi:predicted ATPase/DNA-binding SARP family transcriptional activator